MIQQISHVWSYLQEIAEMNLFLLNRLTYSCVSEVEIIND